VAPNLRFALAAILLVGTTLFLSARPGGEFIPPHQELVQFPQRVGNWTGQDQSIAPDALEILGPGDFLARTFQNDSVDMPPVGLFVAYFPTQGFGNTWHSPKNCLPGAGWTALESSRVKISLPGSKPFAANRYLIAKGSERGLVLYWYWAHGRSTASEYWAKLYLIGDSIRLNRSDGSLIRFSTQLRENESEATGEQRLMSLLRDTVPALEQYLRIEP